MKSFEDLTVAIVGATGAVGATFIDLFRERGLRFRELHLVASPRSAAKRIDLHGRTYPVQALEGFDFSQVDLAFFSAGTAVSKLWAKKAAQQGALVIDNTNAYRMDPETPLVVPQVNGRKLHAWPASGIIANPNCATIPVVRALRPIRDELGLRKVVISTYQAASGAGLTGIQELRDGTRRLLDEERREVPAVRFEAPLAFNVVPSIDVMLDTGFTLEEHKMLQESRKILEQPDLAVSATAVRVPVVNGHSEAVYFESDRPLSLSRVLALLRAADGVQLYQGPRAEGYPTPRTVRNQNDVHVGRVRVDLCDARAGWMWIVSDNLRVGAALNALQIAEQALAHGLLG